MGQHVDQQPGGREVKHRLGNERACQSSAFGGRPPWQAVPGWQERLDPSQAEDTDELRVMSAERAVHCIIEPGQKILLNADPVCG